MGCIEHTWKFRALERGMLSRPWKCKKEMRPAPTPKERKEEKKKKKNSARRLAYFLARPESRAFSPDAGRSPEAGRLPEDGRTGVFSRSALVSLAAAWPLPRGVFWCGDNTRGEARQKQGTRPWKTWPRRPGLAHLLPPRCRTGGRLERCVFAAFVFPKCCCRRRRGAFAGRRQLAGPWYAFRDGAPLGRRTRGRRRVLCRQGA